MTALTFSVSAGRGLSVDEAEKKMKKGERRPERHATREEKASRHQWDRKKKTRWLVCLASLPVAHLSSPSSRPGWHVRIWLAWSSWARLSLSIVAVAGYYAMRTIKKGENRLARKKGRQGEEEGPGGSLSWAAGGFCGVVYFFLPRRQAAPRELFFWWRRGSLTGLGGAPSSENGNLCPRDPAQLQRRGKKFEMSPALPGVVIR